MEINRSMLLAYVILQIFIWMGAAKQSIYKKVIFQHEQNECVCFEQSPELHTVSNILDPNNIGIQRLIIFLYRGENQTIYKYIPDTSKQSLLPDLQFESGDSLSTVSDEHLNAIFMNSNKVIKYSNQHKRIKPPKDQHMDHIEVKKQNFAEQIPSYGNSYVPLPISQNIDTHNNIIDQRPDHLIQYIMNDANDFYSHNVTQNITPIQPTKLKLNKKIQLKAVILDKENKVKLINEGSNIWFGKMKNNHLLSSIHEHGNNASLGKLIRDALKEHGMFVTSNGVLKDLHGKDLNITNLYLRPVFIGETLQYNHVISHPNGTITIPKKLSYTESFILALVNPPKIIAIIPLAEIDLPSNLDMRFILNQYMQSLNINANKNNRNEDKTNVKPATLDNLPKKFSSHTHQPYEFQSYDKFHLGNGTSKEKYKIKVKKIKSNKILSLHTKPNNFKTESSSTFDHNIKEHHTQLVNDSEISRNDQSKISADELNILLQKIMEQYENNSVVRNILTKLRMSNVPDDKHHEETEDKENEHYKETEDMPRGIILPSSVVGVSEDDGEALQDFRIIGGNAATSSGTSINNKGRSGPLNK